MGPGKSLQLPPPSNLRNINDCPPPRNRPGKSLQLPPPRIYGTSTTTPPSKSARKIAPTTPPPRIYGTSSTTPPPPRIEPPFSEPWLRPCIVHDLLFSTNTFNFLHDYIYISNTNYIYISNTKSTISIRLEITSDFKKIKTLLQLPVIMI